MARTLEQKKDDFESRARLLMEKKKSLDVGLQHRNELLRLLEEGIFPLIGGCELPTITSQQLLPALLSIEKRHGKEQAHKVCTFCAEVFTEGIVAGMCEWNPAIVVRDALSPRIRGKSPIVLTSAQFTTRVATIGQCSVPPVTRAALQLSVLLLVRLGELCHAEWKDFNWDDAMWRYRYPTAAKAQGGWRFHYVPLSTQAVRILLDLRQTTGGGRYLFPAPWSPEKPIARKNIIRALIGMGLTSEVSSTDAFRSTAKSVLRDVLRVSPQIVNQQLDHAVKHRKECDYNCGVCLLERRKMMQTWSDYIGPIMLPRSYPLEITPTEESLSPIKEEA